MIRRRTTLKLGIAIGAGAMYLLDPANGAERRARLLDSLVTAPRSIAELAARVTRELEEARRALTEASERAQASIRSITGDDTEVPGSQATGS
jgi:uncharacterized protein (DUF58 family)